MLNVQVGIRPEVLELPGYVENVVIVSSHSTLYIPSITMINDINNNAMP
jgi:hypothetical protein